MVLPRRAEAGGDGLDGEAEEVALGVAASSHELDLDEVERVDVGVADADGALEPGDGGEELGLAGDVEDEPAGAVELVADGLI